LESGQTGQQQHDLVPAIVILIEDLQAIGSRVHQEEIASQK